MGLGWGEGGGRNRMRRVESNPKAKKRRATKTQVEAFWSERGLLFLGGVVSRGALCLD